MDDSNFIISEEKLMFREAKLLKSTLVINYRAGFGVILAYGKKQIFY